MRLAYVMSPGRGDADRLLSRLADALAARNLRCVGAVQTNVEHADAQRCDMDLLVLPDGPVLRISQTLGQHASACRLDTQALESAVGLTEAQLARGADVLIINKFGKQEAGGRGFRALIAEALGRDIPVIVGLNGLNEPAFHGFAEGMADRVAPDLDALLAWLDPQAAQHSDAA